MALTETYATSGLIDPTSNLESSRVFLISGTKDIVVVPGKVAIQYTVRFFPLSSFSILFRSHDKTGRVLL